MDHTRITDEQLDAYLDGQLDSQAAMQVRQAIDETPKLAQQQALQGQVDQSLKRLYAPPQVMPPELEKLLQQAPPAEASVALADKMPGHRAPGHRAPGHRAPNLKRRRLVKNIAVALAACVAWTAVMMQFMGGNEGDSYQLVALADVYSSSIDRGFKPDWVCETEAEFVSTFQGRQDVSLRLAAMPDDYSALGLAYFEGLSEDATSLLARIDGQPVLVMVTKSSTAPNVKIGKSIATGVNIFRTDKHGLVFYEITPFDESRMTSYLELVE